MNLKPSPNSIIPVVPSAQHPSGTPALATANWAEKHNVDLEFIQPGKPMRNGFIVRFNRSYREGELNMYVFQTLSEMREPTNIWMQSTMKSVLTTR